MGIGEEDIVQFEEFVRNELLQLLLEKCSRMNTEFADDEKEFFFGMYASSIDQFKVLRGERILILSMAQHLRELQKTLGPETFIGYFEVQRKYKMGKADTAVFSIGLFYGKIRRKISKSTPTSTNDMASLVFKKLKSFCASFTQIETVRPIDMDMIKIVDFGSGVRADIICPFCSVNYAMVDYNEALVKRFAVQRDKSGCWNFSNLRKHVNRQHSKHDPIETAPERNTPATKNDSNTLSNSFEVLEQNELIRMNDAKYLQKNNQSHEIDDANTLAESAAHEPIKELNNSIISTVSKNLTMSSNESIVLESSFRTNEAMVYAQFSAQVIKLDSAFHTNR